ncbi:MAG: amidase family protein [Dehalococcoidia bacterium]|nr:amidase family protein [Dehalococcoidia bacterium]
MPNELWTKPATELASMVRQGETSSREVVEAFLSRIDAVNPAVNAVTVPLARSARAAADDADRKRDAGEALGALHGVPVTVKENIDLAGSATTQGLPAMAEADPGVDGPHVARIRAAGAIPIARTNLPDFGLRWHTDNALRGATRNPWDAARTPGGSSGGEGAALATGMTPLGLGNDYGGSLRWPAQANGICSLKPTFGRVPDHDANTPAEAPITIQLFAVQGPMARHVEDLRVAFNAMAGRDPRDPNSLPFESTVPAPEIGSRVALVPNPGTGDVDADVAAGVERAGKALEEAGYAVDLKDPPRIDDAYQLWRQLVVCEVKNAFLPQLGPLLGDDARNFLESTIEPRGVGEGRVAARGLHAGPRRAERHRPRMGRVHGGLSPRGRAGVYAAAVHPGRRPRRQGCGAPHRRIHAHAGWPEPAGVARGGCARRRQRGTTPGRPGHRLALPGGRLPRGRRGHRTGARHLHAHRPGDIASGSVSGSSRPAGPAP